MIQADPGKHRNKPLLVMEIRDEGHRPRARYRLRMERYAYRDAMEVFTVAVTAMLRAAEATARGAGYGSPIPRLIGDAVRRSKEQSGTARGNLEELSDDNDGNAQ